MSARRHQVEQFSIPLAVSAARPTLGQLRNERDAMIARLMVLAGHRNQVVGITLPGKLTF